MYRTMLSILFAVVPTFLLATTISVPEDYPAISLALANASAGDTVYVTGGPYYEWGLSIPANVSVVAPGFASVEINALEQGGIFSFQLANASYVIEGFTLTGGHPNSGAAVHTGHANVDLEIRRCVFRNNSATGSAGAISCYGSGSYMRIEECSFLNNTAAFRAGAIFMDGQVAGSTLYVENSAFVGNTAREENGGALFLTDNVDAYFENVSIRNNASELSGGGLYARDSCDVEFYNCLFSGNEGNTGDDFRIANSSLRVHYSDFVGGWNEVENTSSLVLVCCDFLSGADPTTWGLDVLVVDEGCDPTGVGAESVARILTAPVASPNPFNPTTTVSFAIVEGGRVRISVVDLRGRTVARLVDESMDAGRHSAVWDGLDDSGRAVASGVYFSRLETGGQIVHGRMVLVR